MGKYQSFRFRRLCQTVISDEVIARNKQDLLNLVMRRKGDFFFKADYSEKKQMAFIVFSRGKKMRMERHGY